MGVNGLFVNITWENPISFYCKTTVIIIIIIIIIITIIIILLPETRKYWADVQRGIVSSNREKDPF